jgi:hypothetical protein
MTRDRDTALDAAARAYLHFGVLSTPSDKRWLRKVLARQFSFRAAAWVQRQLSPTPWGSLHARLYEALGSDAGLRMFARLHRVKRRLFGGAR